MRRLSLLAVLAAGALVSVSTASASAAAFTGTCELSGTASFGNPLGITLQADSFSFTGSGTCAGTDGTTPFEGAASASASGTGSLSCVASDATGSGSLTLANGDTANFGLTLAGTGTEVEVVLKGDSSGDGLAHASFATNGTAATGCSSNSVSSLKFLIGATAADLAG
jgi:hypothetical protein